MSNRVCCAGLVGLQETWNFRIAGPIPQGTPVDAINTSEDTQRVPRTPQRHPKDTQGPRPVTRDLRPETWDLRPET